MLIFYGDNIKIFIKSIELFQFKEENKMTAQELFLIILSQWTSLINCFILIFNIKGNHNSEQSKTKITYTKNEQFNFFKLWKKKEKT